MDGRLTYPPKDTYPKKTEPSKPVVLIVDDQQKMRRVLKNLLKDRGYHVEEAENGITAVEKIKKGFFDIVITDLRLNDYNGMEILKIARKQVYEPEVILITGYGSIDSAIEAVKLGAFDYLEKPPDLKRIILITEQAIEKRRLKSKVMDLQREVEIYSSWRNIIAESPQMIEILKLVEVISETDSTVLIEGESGTGKELIARAVHHAGQRKKKPFIAVNCGALPEPLLESELFGHVKGAFTGATQNKKGLFEEANGGTILLDEIGDMPLSLQMKLIRVLQGGEVRKVGDNISIRVNTRVIAATNKNLELLVNEGKFREDLFYRLNVIPFFIPPLRERREDIVPMVNHFVEIYSRKFKKKVRGFSQAALEILRKYDWPGNCRELENVIERIVSITNSSVIGSEELKRLIKLKKNVSNNVRDPYHNVSLTDAFEVFEKEFILKSLKRNNWNFVDSARDLGISRVSLWRKMKKHGIKGSN